MTEPDQLGRLSGFITDGPTEAPASHWNMRFINHLSTLFPSAIEHHRPYRFIVSVIASCGSASTNPPRSPVIANLEVAIKVATLPTLSETHQHNRVTQNRRGPNRRPIL